MRVFVTGGSGFAGGHIVEGLVARGHDVHAMARSDRSAGVVQAFGATPSRCELGAVPPEALEGVDAVVHAAAFVEEYGSRAQFEQANVEGTRQLLEACAQGGVARFVHIGTEAVLFDGADLLDLDESHPIPARHRYLYSETKAAAENMVLAANRAGFVAISLRPRWIWGPRDASLLAGLVERVRSGGFAWVDGGRALTSTCHVRNLVHAVDLALTRGQGGQAYFVADAGTRTVREHVTGLLATQGVTPPSRSLPGALLRPLGEGVEGLWRALGVRSAPPITGLAAMLMSRSVTVRTTKAERELGYAPVVSYEDGLVELTREPGGSP